MSLAEKIREIFKKQWKDPKQYMPNRYEDKIFDLLEGYVAVPREQLQKFQDWLSKEANEPAKFQWEIQRKQAFKEVIEKAEDLLRDDGKRPTK